LYTVLEIGIGILVVVTYPPDPLPLGIDEGKGAIFREGRSPSQRLAPTELRGEKYIIFYLLLGGNSRVT